VIIRKLDLCAFSLLHPVFTPVEISPVLPLGSCSAIAKVNQKKILTATRGTEVLSDITNALALECAVRRIACIKTKQTKKHIHLCAGHRHIRTQPIEDEHFRPHFYLFGLCSAGQDQGTMKFETGALFIHLKFYLDFFSAIMKNGITYNVKIVFTDFSGKVSSYIEKTLFREIPRVYPGVKMEWNNNREHAKHYYFPVCFAMSFSIGGEKTYGYIDGGFTDWTAKLTGNRKERLLTSGISFTYILNTIREYLVL
jgi:hypothetical protein